jgi:hypothetical protein
LSGKNRGICAIPQYYRMPIRFTARVTAQDAIMPAGSFARKRLK